MRTPDRRWDLAPEVHRLVGDWARMPRPPDPAGLEEAIREAYRAAGLRPGPVIWCRTPGEYLAVLESPVAHSRLLLAHRHPLVRLRRWRPIGIGAVGQIVVAMVLAVVLMVLALTTWIAATVLSYRLVLAVLGVGLGQSSPVESGVFLACLAGWLLVLWRALPSAISLARRAWTAVARRAWHAEVPWVGELRRPPLDLLPWRALREVAVALAPPVEFGSSSSPPEQPSGQSPGQPPDHPLMVSARWQDGVRHLFVDSERVPQLPAPGQVGRQAELFAHDWVAQHLTLGSQAVDRQVVEQSVVRCYAELGADAPTLRWYPDPASYARALDEVRSGRSPWWVPTMDQQIRDVIRRGITPGGRPGPTEGRLAPVVMAADPLGRFLTRSFSSVATISWRWRHAVRRGALAGLPDEPADRADRLLTALEQNAPVPWTARRGLAVLLEPPPEVRRGELVAEDGHRLTTHSLAWPDGSWWHLIDGVRVPRPAESGDWSVAEIHQVANSEARRVLIEVMGWERYLAEADLPLLAEAPDPANPPHTLRLFALPAPGWQDLNLLVMTNASPGLDGAVRLFAEFVPAGFDDPVAAVAWQYGVPVAVYRTLQRRT